MADKILGKAPISKLFIKYTIPAVLSMILASSQTMIDGLFLGRFVGTNALASVNIAAPYVQIAMSVSMVLAFGALSILGRALGASNYSRAQNAFRTAFIMLLAFGISYGCIGVFFTDQVARQLGANLVLLGHVKSYIRVIAVFLPLFPLMILTGFTSRIVGKPEAYLHATVGSLILNVFLDYVLIARLNMGMTGAALATGLSFALGAFLAVGPLFNKNASINLYSGKWDKSLITNILYNGSSEGIGSASDAIATFIFNIEFMAYAGPEGVAAFTTISYLVRVGIMLSFGVADGISPIVSYNYGSKQFDRVNDVMKYARRLCLGIGLIMLFVLFTKGQVLASYFAKDNLKVIQMAGYGSKIYAFAFLFNSINIIYSVYFTSLGKAGTSAIIALSRGLIGVLVGIHVWKHFFGIAGVWLTIPAAEFITLGIVMVLVKRNALGRPQVAYQT